MRLPKVTHSIDRAAAPNESERAREDVTPSIIPFPTGCICDVEPCLQVLRGRLHRTV